MRASLHVDRVKKATNERAWLSFEAPTMRDFLKERYDWCKSVKRLPLVHEGSCGQVVVVMLWPATNHTEFKLYAFSFNTHHAPETAE